MLIIKNQNGKTGLKCVDGRYKLYRVEECHDRYRFQFRDTIHMEWKLIDIYRKPKWNSERGENMYQVDNGKFKNHWISAKWFTNIDNIKFTFTEALKLL